MTRGWREHPEALEELTESARWYEHRAPGLGQRMLDAVDAAVASIVEPAVSWGLYRGHRADPQVYSRSVAGFPFDIIYVIRPEGVVILAYASERRRPEYWRTRV